MICVKCHQEVPNGAYCALCGAAQVAAGRSRKRGNGQGSVVKRGKTWMVRATVGGYITDDGKYRQIRISKGGFRTRSDAVNYLPDLMAGQNVVYKFQQARDTYEAGPYKKLSKDKQTAYKTALARWEPIMYREVSSVTLGELQAIMDKAVSTYYPAHDMQSVLSHMYKIAMADQQATVNLARLLTMPELVEEEPEPFSEIEIRKLWDAYAQDQSLIYGYILLMIYSGMMPGELMKLRADMVDYEALEIRGCGLKTKKRKEVAIVFPHILVPVIEDLVQHQSRGGKVVVWGRDRFYSEYHKALSTAGVRDLPPYSCRHTTATALALGEIAPSAIQKVMRHAKLATTQRYIHMTDRESHEAIEKMAK